MKKSLLAIFAFAFVTTTVYAADKKPDVKTEKACVTDTKTKKETCKTIKVHKKLEATPVPPAKK
jgi:hypothetical protein